MSNGIGQRAVASRKRVYLDYAATTPLDPRVKRVMEPYFTNEFGNPSSLHAEGVAAKKAVDTARVSVARSLEARSEEIIFTSGGTEANNSAISGVVSALAIVNGRTLLLKGKKPHVVTTNIEHASVLEPIRELERQGRIEVTYVEVSSDGIVKAEKISAAVKPTTVLVSVMYANNEIGTIQPIAKIATLIKDVRCKMKEKQKREITSYNVNLKSIKKDRFPIFHTDACQAPLYLNCLPNALGVDLITLDGHKMYGPKGVGVLYVRRGTPIEPLLFGGGQERGLRSTTENVPGIVGFAEALRIAVAERKEESARLMTLRNNFYSNVLQNMGIEHVIVNGSMKEGERLPNNLNVSFPGRDTEMLTLQLDAVGIAVSTKSSCLKNERESYVVSALGGGTERARASMRFTLGRNTTKKDIFTTQKILTALLSKKEI